MTVGAVLVLVLVAFMIGLIAGVSLTRPVAQYWNKHKESPKDFTAESNQEEDDASEDVSDYQLSGDSSTDAPLPDVKKKKRKGK